MSRSDIITTDRFAQTRRVIDCAGKLVEDGRRVQVLVGSHEAAVARKLDLAAEVTCGIDVQTVTGWTADRWDLVGDGTRVASVRQHRTILEALVMQRTGDLPSARVLADLDAAVPQIAVAILAEAGGKVEPAHATDQIHGLLEAFDTEGYCRKRGLTENEFRVVCFTVAFIEELAGTGLIEPALALRALAGSEEGLAFIVEDLWLQPPQVAGAIAALAQANDVTVIDQQVVPGSPLEDATGRPDELADLHRVLYTGKAGLEPADAVTFAEINGCHAEAASLAELIGDDVGETALILPSGGQAHLLGMLDTFAQHGIPFATQVAVPLADTCLGAAYVLALRCAQALMADGCTIDDAHEGRLVIEADPAGHVDNSYAPLASLLALSACGLDDRDSRALRSWWRSLGGSTPSRRLIDLEYPDRSQPRFPRHCNSGTWRRRTAPLRDVLRCALRLLASEDPAQRGEFGCELVRLLYQNEARAGADDARLADDTAAAYAIYDYLNAQSEFGLPPYPEQVEQLSVTVSRSWAPQDDPDAPRLRLLSFQQARHQIYERAICCNLTAQNFSMVGRTGVFTTLLGRLGIEEPDTQAHRMRRGLIDVIDGCTHSFGAYRVCTDELGEEERQSALWDELEDAYRTPDADDIVPVRSFSEAARFAPAAHRWQVQSVCGSLAREESKRLVMPDIAAGEYFSPTALESYFQCPYGWFTSRRLGIYDIDAAFDAARQGTLAHDVLKRFYDALCAAGMARVTPENLTRAHEILQSAFDEEVADKTAGDELFLRSMQDEYLLEKIRRELADLIDRDAYFLPGFTPRRFELKLGREPELDYAGVPVHGKVDRIDVDERGRAVIVDYKMSSLTSGYGLRQNKNTPERIQTDIYAMLVTRRFSGSDEELDVEGSVYRSYSKNKLRGVYSSQLDFGEAESTNASDAVPRSDEKHPEADVENYPTYLSRIEGEMEGRLENLRAGDIEPSPVSDEACRYCRVKLVCPRERG
ncbi:MAG: PD-(D/E)XK nuclease family protein [Coriobacteriaceae bacterium]|nr:PD-(D/E)XK nuclease family protein [Coriobacteriaceae bacterium]